MGARVEQQERSPLASIALQMHPNALRVSFWRLRASEMCSPQAFLGNSLFAGLRLRRPHEWRSSLEDVAGVALVAP